jgi:hypothetical protein
MKRKRPQHEQRRRPLAELNLLGEPKRLSVRRKGCASLFGSILLLVAAAVSIGLGLH